MLKNKLIPMLCAIGITFSTTTKVLASNDIQRIWGSDRYATAIEISKNGWTDGSEYAVLANGGNFPDALSAAPLAKKYNAPILLNSGNYLDSRVEGELKRLNVKQIFIIGGTAVIPTSVEERLSELNIKATRLFGQDRYETAIKVAEQLDFTGQVSVANGENFPDALSICPIAAQKSMPVILTPPNALPDAVAKYIKSNKITKTYVIGEDDVVSDAIANSFPNSERIWGSSKYDTNIAVLEKFENELNFNKIYIANGENFPDALAGSALAAKNSSAVILVSEYAGQSTKNFMLSNVNSKCETYILGGNAVIPDEQIDNLMYAEGNTNGNLILGGIAAKQGEWAYYTDGYGRLFKSKEDGSLVTKLLDSQEYHIDSNINVVGDWVYCNLNNSIYKIKTDGSSKSKVADGSILTVKDNTIYFGQKSDKDDLIYLCKANTDGLEKTTLTTLNEKSSINIVGDWVYYIDNSDNNEIYKMKLDGSSKMKVRDEAVTQIIVDKDYIYYSTLSGIYRINTDNSDPVCIVNSYDIDGSFNIADNWIYYPLKDGGLYKVETDGTSNVKIADANTLDLGYTGMRNILSPTIIGDWVYYKCAIHTPGDDYYTYLCKVKIDGSENTLVNLNIDTNETN
ncbi:cell wall-binding repeat-containing protein [Clostridium sp. WILCCON 0269]|uniref:Cell wall-binding repeat-containing protein n=1 Tax=Candidatus Clostridium eludens TaxID=3381663 RepID=A0ABW8SJN9_9CLOT